MAVRSAVLAPLAHWITGHWVADGPLRLLDVGCGDLLLARLLPGSYRIDGYDTSGEARAAARRTLADLGRDWGTVHDVPDQVPAGAFDGVILSSMLQYLPDRAAVGDLLGDVARWLRPDGFGVIATDVVDPGAGRLDDGRDLLAFLVAQQGPVRGAVMAVRAARRSPGGLLALDDHDMAVQAARAGLTACRLAANLSPLRHRASYCSPGPPARGERWAEVSAPLLCLPASQPAHPTAYRFRSGGDRGVRTCQGTASDGVRADDLIIISVDDHLVEPPDMFEGRLAAEFADRAPRVIERDDGREMWLFEGVEIPNFGLNAVSGRPQEEYGIEPTRFDEIRPGLLGRRRPHRRHERRRRAGVACASRRSPSSAARSSPTPTTRSSALAVLQAYNDWHVEDVVRRRTPAGSSPCRSRPTGTPS